MFRFPPKVVSWLCLLQTSAVSVGFLLTRALHKVYLQRPDYELHKVRHPVAWFTRLMLDGGPWFLLLPFTWGLVATSTADMEGGIAETSPVLTRFGYAISAALATFAVLSAMQMLGAAWDMGKITRIPGAE